MSDDGSWGRLRILVVDDDPHVRAALVELVRSDNGLELSGVAADADVAVALCAGTSVDAAIVDVKMPGGGPSCVRGIRAVSPKTAVVALSAYDDDAARRTMRDAGAAAYLVKGGSIADLLNIVRSAASDARRRHDQF